MGRRILGLAVLVAVLIGGVLLWRRDKDIQEAANGDVHCVGCMTPAERARFLKENAGETPDEASDHKSRTARDEAPTSLQDAASVPANGRSEAFASESDASASAAGPSTASEGSATQKQLSAFTLTNNGNPQIADTLPPNAQDRSRFGGSGRYQWYRQGNLTWRVDTTTGRSCVVYATMEEWRKPIVLSHGCGPNA